MADMTTQRAQQQIDHITKVLRTRNQATDAEQLEQAVEALKTAERLKAQVRDNGTLARMAGNIASGIAPLFVQLSGNREHELIVNLDAARIAHASVLIARAIVGELQTTEESK